MYQYIHIHVREKSDNHLGSGSLDNVNYPLYFVWWICSKEGYRVLQTDAQLLGSFCESGHAIIAIIIICSNCSYPSPTKVLDQLGQGSALVVITGYCS